MYHVEYNITCHITELCRRIARQVVIIKVHHNYSAILGLEQRSVDNNCYFMGD